MLPRLLLLQGAASVQRRPSAPERTGGGGPRTWSHRGAQFLGAAGRRADAARSRRAVRHAYLRRRLRRTTLLFSSVSACARCLFLRLIVVTLHCPFFLFVHSGLAGTQAYALASPPAHVLFFFFWTFSLSFSPSPANLRCSLPNSTATCGDACTTQPAPGIRTPFCGSSGEGDGCAAHPRVCRCNTTRPHLRHCRRRSHEIDAAGIYSVPRLTSCRECVVQTCSCKELRKAPWGKQN